MNSIAIPKFLTYVTDDDMDSIDWQPLPEELERLFRAAPDLLAACESIADIKSITSEDVFFAALNAIKAAIAKAKPTEHPAETS